MQQTALPIDDVLAALQSALEQQSNVVLEAPPGAGKTTRVPLSLRAANWLGKQRIIMLEPRRLAARTAAHYMSARLGERVGETVGFRVRGESRVGPNTRIEVVTEGILARLIASDPSLEGIGLVIFDEFHERSLHADLGLALTLQTQQLLRPELRVLVMSATLDGDAVGALLSQAADKPAPVIRSAGRMYPVETLYRPRRGDERIEATVSRAILEAVQEQPGDILVFLPGASEQRRVAARIAGNDVVANARARVHTLHGAMPLAEQDAAISAAPIGQRKIVLATSIAETSLTIEGVRVVIDCGLSRLPRYSARVGITRLETVRVSRASADQRRGRAGRVAAGVCYRLWDAQEDAMLAPRTRPEILEADLAPLALALADAGVSNPSDLRWLDSPPVGAFQQARELLTQLGALNESGRITPHGQQIAALPTHPRLAHLLIRANEQGESKLGATLCALVEERDILRGEFGPPVVDLRLRLDLLNGTSESAMGASLAGANVDHDGIRRLRQVSSDLQQRLRENSRSSNRANQKSSPSSTANSVKQNATLSSTTNSVKQHPILSSTANSDDAGSLLALAYPDRIAQRRTGSDARYLLRSGTGASLPRHDAIADSPFLAIADLDGAPPEFRIARAIPITRAEIDVAFSDQFIRESVVEWDSTSRAVRARNRTRLGAIVLDDHAVANTDPGKILAAFIAEIARVGADALPWSDDAQRTRARLNFLHTRARDVSQNPTWPDTGNDALTSTLNEWLAPSIAGLRKWDELSRVDLSEALLSLLNWEQRAALDKLAPTHLDVPSGSRIALNYEDATNPVLAVKLQEVFGWTTTPMLLDGRVPVTLHLLSPAQRPVQVTQDLAGFWRTSYFDVRKDLRGRYPRHPWPEDPLSAVATRRAKPRGT
ncbi:MAG: ATP-dependent helicase HrpB [Gemmatimonadaceae bacterium]